MQLEGNDAPDRQFDRAYQQRLDSALRLLAHRRRRFPIERLRGRDGSVARSDILDCVIEAEYEGGRAAISEEDRRTVVVDLFHSHLPMLVSAGVVERTADGIAYVGDHLVETVHDYVRESLVGGFG